MRNRTMGAWRADDSVECELSKDCGEGREEEEEGRLRDGIPRGPVSDATLRSG